MAQRSAQQIRDSMEANRMELAKSVEQLRGEVERATDWRGHLRRHQPQLMAAGAVVVGVVVLKGLARRRRRRRGR